MISEKEAVQAAIILCEFCKQNDLCTTCLFGREGYCVLIDGFYPDNWAKYLERLKEYVKEEN